MPLPPESANGITIVRGFALVAFGESHASRFVAEDSVVIVRKSISALAPKALEVPMAVFHNLNGSYIKNIITHDDAFLEEETACENTDQDAANLIKQGVAVLKEKQG